MEGVAAMKPFIHESRPCRVVFAEGSVDQLPAEVERLGAKRVMLISGGGRRALADRLAARLGHHCVDHYNKAAMHVPHEQVTEAGSRVAELEVDCCVTVGGGSAIGLGKMLALTAGLPVIAIPSTYSGSEMTPIYGYTQDRVKRTGRDPLVRPKTVIYDPLLTLTLPVAASTSSGMNAMAHCIEAIYAADADPITVLMAEEGLRSLVKALPMLALEPGNRAARSLALYGAWLAGMSLAGASMGLHHQLCHVLGGAFNLPHAQTHALVLAHVVHYNRDAVPDAMHRIGQALGSADPADGLYRLLSRLALPAGLGELGVPRSGIEGVARRVAETPYPNPAPVLYDRVHALLLRAHEGLPPMH